jgi:hypothetical protein
MLCFQPGQQKNVMWCCFPPKQKRSIGDELFTHPHGLRMGDDDNLSTTDDGSHLVMKLSPGGEFFWC